MKVRRCATARASVSADSVCATRPILVAYMGHTASVTTSPASGSEERFAEVCTHCNTMTKFEGRKRKRDI